MTLSESQKKYLRGLGHKLKPVVTVGDAGISDALLSEFNATIAHHELIKVRVRADSREGRDAMIDELCRRGAAELVARIGNVALLYRPHPGKPRVLPASH
jgi:RNA-binding protein